MSADHSAPGTSGRNPIEEDDAQTSASSEGEDPADAEDDEERARQEKLQELRKSYKYARVLDPFDPWEQGYASESDEQSIYLKVEYDDVIEISQRGDNGWWEGSIFDQSRGRSVGEPGKFPADFVQPVPDPYWMEGDDELEAAESSGLGAGSEENRSAAEAASEAAKVMHKRWRNANRLFLALLELVTNEFKYVLSLQICYEVYIEGILDAFGEEYVGSLFPSWQRIWQCHEDILHGLADASRATWKRLLRFPDKSSPRSASGSSKREHNRRQSVGAPMGKLKNNTSEMCTLAEELDAIQAWHDENVLEDEASLSEDDLQHFLKLLGDWSVQVCHALETMAGKLKMSSVYIRNYNDALRLYDIWTRQVKGFPEKIYELEQNPKANKLNLSSYLIKPVQHVCRYPLLVREVHKYAADDASKDAILQCQERLIEVTTEVNSLQDDANPSDLSLTLQDLRNGLRYPNEKVHATVDNILRKDTTQLMKIGVVHIVQAGKGLILKALKTGDAGAPYECFLMNSVLLLTERHQNILSKNRFKLRCYVDVKCVGVSGVIESHDSRMFGFSTQTDDDPNPFSGSLMSKPSKWVFRVGSIAERDAWLRNLEQAMYISRGISSSGSSPKGQGMYDTATAALNAAQSSRTPSVRSIATAPASVVAGIFGQRSQHQQPQQHQQHQHQQQDNRPDNAQYNSMKDRQNTLQNAHPSYLMQLTNEDPILNELKTRLKQKQSKQSMIDELM
ncbi:FYVE, RhoGEF and PH domain-containing protein 2 [Hondaea fermentalgiana]|uniref:FYVE, RhoGEF and PH domain-containing protein 2 n=1 Tax=Hondaea fermentalgiana TaxID=2315210 RepID=A0A2R5GJP0_9STRA|nr:FYVE, RhoGEF and PH domain-containing protein 2 [Hondaea fermentalgiana]|eukprot:GBG28074.1 FYVE, RhoGEF and PH domain-containing protein 2 [Hondaea fermentalgiana]